MRTPRLRSRARHLRGKVVVLTGASSGIGRATALELASEGAILHLIARRQERLEQVCERAQVLGASATPHVLDVRDADAYAAVAAGINAEHGRIDVLINNAGVGPARSFLETTDDDWKWTIDTNLFGVVTGIRAFLPAMLEHGAGTIVNVASLAGLVASDLVAYTASKAAVVGLSESLLIELGNRGIDIIVVCPGIVDTEITAAGTRAGRTSPSHERRLQHLLSTYGTAPEVVARDIVRAVRNPRFMVLSPSHATLLRTLHRVSPGLVRTMLRRLS